MSDQFERTVRIRDGKLPDSVIPDALGEVAGRFEPSTNLFDKNTVTLDTVLAAGGATTTHTDYVLSDWIPVTPSADYTFGGNILRVTWFAAAKAWISDFTFTEWPTTRTAPAGAVFMRVSVLKIHRNAAQVNAGDTLLAYQDGTPLLKSRHMPPVGASWSAITGKPLGTDHRLQLIQSKNLMNRDTALLGYRFASGASEPEVYPTYAVSDYIPVIPGQMYTYTRVVRLTYFDSTGVSRVGSHDGPATTVWSHAAPATAAMVRLSFQLQYLNVAQMVAGTEELPYTDGGRIPPEALDLPRLLPLMAPNIQTAERYVIDAPDGLDQVYTAPTIPDYLNLQQTVATDVHGWFDTLVSAHPGYVTKTDLGASSSPADGNLFSYTFRSPPVTTHVNGTSSLASAFPKVLILGGVHGYEKAGPYNAFNFAKELCESDGSDPVIDALRNNFEFIIVPVCNPYGWNREAAGLSGSRGNANGVDLARNFTESWAEGVSAGITNGTGPLSEPEAVIMDDLMSANKSRLVLVTSLHNFSSGADNPNHLIWCAAATQLQLNVGKRLIARMTRKWKKLPGVTNTADYFGWADREAPIGSESRQARRYGIHGATFEVSRIGRLGGAGVNHNSQALTLGLEATVNYIAMSVREAVRYHNTYGVAS